MQLHIFNPDHDEALAYAMDHYIADKASRQLAADLSCLPAWWASTGDAIQIPSGTQHTVARWAETVAQVLPLLRYVTVDQWPTMPIDSVVQPWGWNRSLRHMLLQGDFAGQLPSEAYLDHVRQVSSRRTAQAVLSHLHALIPQKLVGQMHYLETEESVSETLSAHTVTLLKAPWSGSGRGLRRGFGVLQPPLTGWVRRVLSRQGGLMAEPFYDKVCDLALEYFIDAKGCCTFRGLSLFRTSGVGGYAGNLLGTYEQLLHQLPSSFDTRILSQVRHALQRILPSCLGHTYRGPLGVDMMLVRQGRDIRLHPCVEVNCRQTMGHLAVALSSRLHPQTMAQFTLHYARSPQALRSSLSHYPLLSEPLVTQDGYWRRGSLSLTPLTPQSCFYASLTCLP